MKRNRLLLSDQVYVKLMGDAVTSIVAEAFIDSLPLNREAVAVESDNLAEYCTKVISTMHPETLIDRAIEAADDPLKIEYLENLRDEISAVVEAATTKIVNKECFGTCTTPEIVQQAKLDDEDVDALVKASQRIGIDSVSNLVKKKMIDTIKDEKTSFEESEKIRNEVKNIIRDEADDLKDSLNEDDSEKPGIIVQEEEDKINLPEYDAEPGTDNGAAEEFAKAEKEAEASVESYFKLVLNPTDPRYPVSVFSRIQDICMENLSCFAEQFEGEIPYDALTKITLESTFPFFDLDRRSLADDIRSLQISTESAVELSEMDPEKKAHHAKSIAKTSFICTICILTLLEVLKTMNIAKPDINMVRDLVDKSTNVQNASDTDIERIERKVDDAATDIKKSVALGALSATETAVAKESLSKIRDNLEKIKVDPSMESTKTRVLKKITEALDEVIGYTEPPIRLDSVAARIKETNIANLDRAIRALSRKPDVATVKICVDSSTRMGADDDQINLRAIGVDKAGKTVCDMFFDFNLSRFMGESLADALRDCGSFCEIKVGHKPVEILFMDQGYSVPLTK